MGYRGKLEERARARQLRAEAWTLQQIAEELGVSRSSVSRWVRDVEFATRPGRVGPRRVGRNRLRDEKLAQMEQLRREGRDRIGELSGAAFLAAGAALYAGEGGKRDGALQFANSDPGMIAFFLVWLRHFFPVDERRLRIRLYLHEELDLDAAERFWSELTGIPRSQFGAPYRAPNRDGVRRTKHVYGCPSVRYSCATTHRAVMGLVAGLFNPRSVAPYATVCDRP
jgi:transcriptional regulator with XRE-family HTH domain